MRLVDAEQFDFISFQGTGEQRYDDGFEDGIQYLANKLDAAPTVAAIPVAWLNEQCEMADDRGDMEMTDAISWLIQTWQEEQEAKQ